MSIYKKCKNDQEIESLEPHNWSSAIRAWNYCLERSTSQSIIVSGESGAGKTESTKLCLQLLSDIGGESGIEKKLMQSSPILELFGNAKTVRNSNSSRLGKWMQMIIDLDQKKIVGVGIVDYLLKKSRVATVGKDERNYHAFYWLLKCTIKQLNFMVFGWSSLFRCRRSRILIWCGSRCPTICDLARLLLIPLLHYNIPLLFFCSLLLFIGIIKCSRIPRGELFPDSSIFPQFQSIFSADQFSSFQCESICFLSILRDLIEIIQHFGSAPLLLDAVLVQMVDEQPTRIR